MLIFDSLLNGMPAIDMYRSWVIPELYPHERQPQLQNWTDDDREAYCGIYVNAM